VWDSGGSARLGAVCPEGMRRKPGKRSRPLRGRGVLQLQTSSGSPKVGHPSPTPAPAARGRRVSRGPAGKAPRAGLSRRRCRRDCRGYSRPPPARDHDQERAELAGAGAPAADTSRRWRPASPTSGGTQAHGVPRGRGAWRPRLRGRTRWPPAARVPMCRWRRGYKPARSGRPNSRGGAPGAYPRVVRSHHGC